jgi:hypothetical protein
MVDDLWTYEDDGRTVPTDDDTRLAPFKAGWTVAVQHEKDSDLPSAYSDDPTLDHLTWHNLGFRLGSFFGETSPELKEELYEWCRKQQRW